MKTITIAIFGIMLLGGTLILSGCSKDETAKKEDNSKKNEKTATQQTSGAETKTPPVTPAGSKIAVVAEKSKLEWEGKKVTGKHNGIVKIKSGDLYLENEKITGGSFDIDFTTIEVLDIKDAEMNAKLTTHLKSDDFFAASNFPVGKFVISNVEAVNDEKGNNVKVNGSLTIKGISKPVSFPAKVSVNSGNVTASGEFTIDRTQWDIKFRSGKFFENLGDNLIYDDFTIRLNLAAGV